LLASTLDTTLLKKVGVAFKFTLSPKGLASFNTVQSVWIADAGNYIVKICASSEDIKLSKSFILPKERLWKR
jgi:hypothetical protein